MDKSLKLARCFDNIRGMPILPVSHFPCRPGIGVKVTQRLEVFNPMIEPRTTRLSPLSIDQSQFLSKSAKTFLTSVFQCCLWFAKNRDCDEILPYHGENTDQLGFESSKIILATDLTHQSKQSLIFAFGEGTAEVAIGYFPQMAKEMTKMPRVRKKKLKSLSVTLAAPLMTV